ncbi:MAG: hypothetical protein IIA41_07465, partial [SAR324 cluster bacterium]|nr:hypothetical protein [SAR324 cluster bacterium]
MILLAAPISAQEKPRVAILNFEVGGASQVEADAIAEKIRKVFVNSGEYTVIDRTLTSKILEEWEIQQSGLTDEEKAIRFGKLYNVQAIVTGKLLKFPEGGWLVSAVMLDAETGVAEKAETVRHRGNFFDLLDREVPGLAVRLTG